MARGARARDARPARRGQRPIGSTSTRAGPGSASCSTAAGPVSRGRRSTAAAARRTEQAAIFARGAGALRRERGLRRVDDRHGRPVLLRHGTDAQTARYLRPLLRADETWCQLFSEPAPGSDLANLATRADARRRRVRRQRAEGVDVERAPVRLRDPARAHEPRRTQAPRHLVPAPRSAHARGRGAAAAPDHRRRALQRGVPDRRAHPGRERRR